MSGAPQDLTTLHLVHRAKKGEQEALELLFERYYSRVRKIVGLRLGGKLRSVLDLDDILQETFLGAFKSFNQFEFRDNASVINWLSRIAERAILSAAQHFGAEKRGQGRRLAIDHMDGDDQSIRIPDEGRRGPRSSMSAREESGIVEECISQLSEQYREIIILRDYVGYGWEAIAQEHGRPSEAAARMMHGRAMMELNSLLRERIESL